MINRVIIFWHADLKEFKVEACWDRLGGVTLDTGDFPRTWIVPASTYTLDHLTVRA